MSDDCGGEVLALKAVIEACRDQAGALDMPALAYLLDKAAVMMAAHAAEAGAPRLVDCAACASPTSH